jgi:membrane protein implicated in regulation of membrane protease activity
MKKKTKPSSALYGALFSMFAQFAILGTILAFTTKEWWLLYVTPVCAIIAAIMWRKFTQKVDEFADYLFDKRQ